MTEIRNFLTNLFIARHPAGAGAAPVPSDGNGEGPGKPPPAGRTVRDTVTLSEGGYKIANLARGREPVPHEAPPLPAPGPPAPGPPRRETVAGPITPAVDVHNLSPRQMAETSMDLYMVGAITWKEHAMLAFQPELHPDYDQTVGALTGEKADPDRPRDYVAIWEERLAFERKHNAGNDDRVERSRRIVNVLRQIAVPTNIVV